MSAGRLKVRLQGGPFDGHRRIGSSGEVPERIYAVPCVFCGSHWYSEMAPRAEVYRHDEEHDGWHVFVFTDESLGGFLGLVETVTTPAGATS